MPNRILREGILTSDRVDQLDASAEVFYRRLMSKVDDHGLYDARPSILRASLYPLRVDRVREADISRSLAACQSAGLLALYQHDGKPYLQMLDTKWQTRSEPKFPVPQATDNSCAQLIAAAPVFVFGVGDVDEKARKRATGFDAEAIELPEWLSREVWIAWCKDRKARKKPISEAGAKAQLAKLDGYRRDGHPAKEVIEHSIAGGYQGLFAPARKGAQAQSTTVAGESNDAYRSRMAAERAAEAERLAGSKGPPAELLAKVRKAIKEPA
jgi:hypothetical protein